MALIDKDQLKAEINRLRVKHYNKRWLAHWWARAALTRVEKLLDTLPEQPVEWEDEYREEDLRTRFAFYTYKNEEDNSVLYLSNVFVEEASRNAGFGTKILEAAEKVAETIGAITIRLKVKQNSPANTWYRKRGYGYIAFEGEYDWLEKNLEYLKPKRNEQPVEGPEEYCPYKTTIESILKMFDSYSITTDKADFIANIRVKCKDAVEYATGKRPVETEEKDVFCKENCKGYQDTRRCFCDGGCEAKKKSKEKEVDLEKEISNYYTLKKPEIWFHQFHELAHHFYDLGKNARNE